MVTMAQQAHRFEKEIQLTKRVNLQYLLHVPKASNDSTTRKWPLIVFLHGRDLRGDNLERLKVRGIPHLIEDNSDFPFIVLSPQCPSYYIWPFVFDGIMALIEELQTRYPVDVKRIYLTGLSMGGFAAWDLAMEYPDYFAAIAPVCAGGSQERVDVLLHTPVWAFHGAKDEVVPVDQAANIVNRLKQLGGDAQLTIFPEGGHDISMETYRDSNLYSWFLEHARP